MSCNTFYRNASTVPNLSDSKWSLWAKALIRLSQIQGTSKYLPTCVDTRWNLIRKFLLVLKTVNTGWTPLTPGTILEWLKADNINQTNNTAVATWPHSAGVDATATGGGQPTFLTNQQNGLPIVRFNGTTNFMVNSALTVQSQPFTFAIAYKYRGPGTADHIFAGIDVSPVLYGNTANQVTFNAGTSANLVPTDSNFDIMFLVVNGASSTFGFNGGALTSMGVNVGGRTFSGFAVGSDAANLSPAQVDIGEIMAWSGDGTSFYNQAYTYLNNRWA